MAIQQHPVPQDISNYKFRLIGDMTIKQFAALGISIVLAVIVYSSPMPFFFKYPLSFFLLLLGVGTAFVPFQGRTLDVWIVAFIKSIYSPTQYIWKHGQQTPLTATDNSTPQTPIVEISAPATDTVSTSQTPPLAEKTSDVLQTQNQQETLSASTINSSSQDENTTANTQTNISPVQPTETTQPLNLQTETNLSVNNSTNIEEKIDTDEKVTTPPTDQIPTDIIKPQTNQPSINNDLKSVSSLPIPFTPTTPNTLVGLTLTPQGQILDGVLVEIKNQNITVRATRSNKLGQFLFVRPLENGLYQILAEKEGFNFENYSIQLEGEIINPLRIQALK